MNQPVDDSALPEERDEVEASRTGAQGFAGTLVRIFDAIDRKVVVPSAIAALLALTILVTADAAMRYFARASIPYLSDVTGKVLMPMTVFLAVSYVGAVRGNVAVDIFFQKFSARVKRLLHIAFDLIAAAFIGCIGWQFFSRFLGAIGERSSTFEVHPTITFGIIALGCVYGALRFLVNVIAGIADTRVSELAEDQDELVDAGA